MDQRLLSLVDVSLLFDIDSVFVDVVSIEGVGGFGKGGGTASTISFSSVV